MTPYSQRDPRWGSDKINNTQYTIATDGCLITCLGMVSDTAPDVVNNIIGFTGAQVNWTGLDGIGLELVEKSNVYDNAKVLEYIAAYGFCIVRVDWDGSPKTGGDTHFVTYIGNHQLIDPWTGTLRPTGAYPLTTGYRAVKRIGGDMPLNDEIIGKSSQRDEVVNHYHYDIGTAVPGDLLVKVQEEVQKAYDRGKAEGGQPQVTEPPENISVNGNTWVLNGLEWVDGKLIGNYKRQ